MQFIWGGDGGVEHRYSWKSDILAHARGVIGRMPITNVHVQQHCRTHSCQSSVQALNRDRALLRAAPARRPLSSRLAVPNSRPSLAISLISRIFRNSSRPGRFPETAYSEYELLRVSDWKTIEIGAGYIGKYHEKSVNKYSNTTQHTFS